MEIKLVNLNKSFTNTTCQFKFILQPLEELLYLCFKTRHFQTKKVKLKNIFYK